MTHPAARHDSVSFALLCVKRLTGALFFASLMLVASLRASTAEADSACHMGESVATSANGNVEAVSSDWGCRSHPSRDINIRRGSRVQHVVRSAHFADQFLVSDDGHWLVADHTHRRYAEDAGVTVYRDGRLVGTFGDAALFGATHEVIRERLHFEVALHGASLRLHVLGASGTTDRPLAALRAPTR